MPLADADRDVIEGWLSGEAGRRVRLVVPKRGEKRGLLDLAARNAEVAYQARFNGNVAANYDALETLRVGARSSRRTPADRVFRHLDDPGERNRRVDGRVRRRADEAVGYRKFRIRGNALARGSGVPRDSESVEDVHSPAELQRLAADAPDARTPAPGSRFLNDFAAMHEVVLRRYRKLLEAGGPFPDLILIDGGKGQLSSAYAALQELGLANLVAAGIAKKEELLFTRDVEEAIALPADSPSLLLIQRIRDEAHRFAITFHRLSRTKRDLQSELDAIGGIGPRRRKALLTAFGSLAGVRRATREELMTIVGAKCADAVLAHFARQG